MFTTLMATSTLTPVTRSFRSERQVNAVPGETGGATEPDDDSRQMADTAIVHHSSRRASTGSTNGQTPHHGRHHRRSGSHSRKRVKRPERSPDAAPLEIADVDPEVLALLETQMKEAAYAVQMSVSEAAALQARLVESHTEVSSLLHTCQATAEREMEQTADMTQLKAQLEAQWLELSTAAANESEAVETAAATT